MSNEKQGGEQNKVDFSKFRVNSHTRTFWTIFGIVVISSQLLIFGVVGIRVLQYQKENSLAIENSNENNLQSNNKQSTGKIINKLADVVIGQGDLNSTVENWTPAKPHRLNTPDDILIANEKLIVADTANNRVLIYNSIPNTNIPTPDVVIGQTDFNSNIVPDDVTGCNLRQPTDIDYYDNKLFITDQMNNRILIYNSIPNTNGACASNVIGQVDLSTNAINQGLETPGSNTLYRPRNLNIHNGKMFITDWYNHRILIYNSIPTTDGASANNVLGQTDFTSNVENSGGRNASSLRYPLSTAVIDEKLFIVDRHNHRILVHNVIPSTDFAPADYVIGQPNLTGGGAGLGDNRLYYPTKITSDGTMLFVADGDNNRVLIFNTIPTINDTSADIVLGQTDFSTRHVNHGGISGKSIHRPNGILFYESKLYIVDTLNHRLMYYNAIPTSNFPNADGIIGQVDANPVNSTSEYGFNSAVKGVYVSDNGELYVVNGGGHKIHKYNSIPNTNGAGADLVIGQPSTNSIQRNGIT